MKLSLGVLCMICVAIAVSEGRPTERFRAPIKQDGQKTELLGHYGSHKARKVSLRVRFQVCPKSKWQMRRMIIRVLFVKYRYRVDLTEVEIVRVIRAQDSKRCTVIYTVKLYPRFVR